MPKKEPVVYTVEREFLSNISVQELVRRIVNAHISSDTVEKENRHV